MKPAGPTLILGVTSGIGKAVAHHLAARGQELLIAGRDQEELQAIAVDLQIRYQIPVHAKIYEAADFGSHESFIAACEASASAPLAGVVFCQGTMSDQAEAEHDFAACQRMIDVNYTSAVSLLNLLANRLAERRAGYICALSSVAGDRGRQSNYIYGSTKAALTVYLQGLRNRLARRDVAVVTVKPGFVDTAMTWGLLKPGSPLVASPNRVAADIVRAIDRRTSTIYTPWFWRGIMAIIKSIPEPIFKRMKL